MCMLVAFRILQHLNQNLYGTGVAGMLPCEATLTAPEVRALLKLALRPAVLWWLLRGRA